MNLEPFYYQTVNVNYSFILTSEFASNEDKNAYIEKISQIVEDKISKKYYDKLGDIIVEFDWNYSDDTETETVYELSVICELYCDTYDEDFGFEVYTEKAEDIIAYTKDIITENTENIFHKTIKDEIYYYISGNPDEVDVRGEDDFRMD